MSGTNIRRNTDFAASKYILGYYVRYPWRECHSASVLRERSITVACGGHDMGMEQSFGWFVVLLSDETRCLRLTLNVVVEQAMSIEEEIEVFPQLRVLGLSTPTPALLIILAYLHICLVSLLAVPLPCHCLLQLSLTVCFLALIFYLCCAHTTYASSGNAKYRYRHLLSCSCWLLCLPKYHSAVPPRGIHWKNNPLLSSPSHMCGRGCY